MACMVDQKVQKSIRFRLHNSVYDMEDPNIDEAYKILEKNYVIVPKHIKNLFNKLSLVGLRVWANIEDCQLETYQDVIKGILADDKICQPFSQEERKALFGDIFWSHPKDFKFLPGDQAVITQMREVSKELLKKNRQQTSHHPVQDRDIKQNTIPIIDIDVEIKKEVEEPEKSKVYDDKVATSSNCNHCDERADFSEVVSDPNIRISVSRVQTKEIPTIDKVEANGTISQSNYKESNQEPASSNSSLTAPSDDINSQASSDCEPNIKYTASKSVENEERATSPDTWGTTLTTLQSRTHSGILKSPGNSNSSWTNDFNSVSRCRIQSYECDEERDVSNNCPKSDIPIVENSEVDGRTTVWIAASDERASTTLTQIVAAAPKAKQNAEPVNTDDRCVRTESLTKGLKVKESTSCTSISTDGLDACAGAWASAGMTTTNSSKAITSYLWGTTETVKSFWIGGHNTPGGGRGGEFNEGHMSYNCSTDPIRGRGGGRRGGGRGGSGGSTRACYKSNEEGHMSYNCPTGPTRGRRGGRGGGVSTRPCFKCNQDGHSSYNCPTASNGGARNSPASTYGAPNSSTSVPVFDDWGTLTVTPSASSSNYDSGEKKNDWGSRSGSASGPFATGANAAPRGSRNTPRSNYNAPISNAQPAVDDWGISSNQSTVPVVKTSVSRTTTGDSGADDWGTAADAWSSVKTSKSTPRSGNSIVDKAGGDDWVAVTDSWEDHSSMSNAERGPITNSKISQNGPNAIRKTGIEAFVSKNSLVSNVRATPSLLEMDNWNVTRSGKRNDTNLKTNNEESNQSVIYPIVWSGTINHRRRSFKTNMKHLDINAPSVLADLEMPKSMRVMGTIEPKKVWTYLKRVRETISERICVFELSPATIAEMDGYKFFFDELNGTNWFAVIADAPDTKLPWSFKDFYVLPLAKESLVPIELITFVKKTFAENRTSDLFLGIVVFRAQRSIDKSRFNPSLPEKTSFHVTQDEVESESIKIQESNSSELSPALEVDSAHTRVIAIQQKLQQVDHTRALMGFADKATNAVASEKIGIKQDILNPLKRQIATRKKKTISMLADATITTPKETGILDLTKTRSSESVRAILPSTLNLKGPMTRSRLRHSQHLPKSNKSSSFEQVVETGIKTTTVPNILQNPTRRMDENDTRKSQTSTSGFNQEKIEETSSVKYAYESDRSCIRSEKNLSSRSEKNEGSSHLGHWSPRIIYNQIGRLNVKMKKTPKKRNYTSRSTSIPSKCDLSPAKVQKTTNIDRVTISSS